MNTKYSSAEKQKDYSEFDIKIILFLSAVLAHSDATLIFISLQQP